MRHSTWPIFLLLNFCLTSPSVAQYRDVSPEEAEHDMCTKVGCAFNVHVVLKKKNGSMYDKSLQAVPVVQPGGVSVYAGQSVLFEADIQGDQHVNLKLVKTVAHPEKTLSSSFGAEAR